MKKVYLFINGGFSNEIEIDKNINKKYDAWREQGYGVLSDRDGDIFLDNEDSDDDGFYYNEQIENL